MAGRLYQFAAIFAATLTTASAWTFSAVQNGQCAPLTVTWAGGKSPFTISVHPFGGSSKLVTVPDSAVSSGQGSYEMTLEVPKGGKFLVTMGDADGLLSGGTSGVLTAGDQPGSAQNCNTTYVTPDFFWSANADDNVEQCQTYPFTEIGTSSGAKIERPASLLVLIPGGDQSFSVQLPNAPSFAWVANVKQGTQVVFDMTDTQNNQGGVANGPVEVKAGDSSCELNNGSKKTSTANPGATGTSSSSSGGSSGGLSKGALIGIVVGAVALIGLIAVLVVLLLRKRNQSRRNPFEDKPVNLLSHEGNPRYSLYSDRDQSLPEEARPSPFYDSQSSRPASHYPPSTYHTSDSSSQYNPYSDYPTKPPAPQTFLSPAGYSHDAAPGPSRTTSVIQHSDIADTEPVELPPQYSVGRAPLQQFSAISDYTPSTPSETGTTGGASSASGTQRSNSMRKGPR